MNQTKLLLLASALTLIGFSFWPSKPNKPELSQWERKAWASTKCESCSKPLNPDNPQDGLWGDKILCQTCGAKREKRN